MDPSKDQSPPPYSGHEFNNPGYASNHNPGPFVQPSPGPMYQPQPTIVMAPPSTQTTTNIVLAGGGTMVGCPSCHNNSWTGTYSCCAWLLAICCFPCGIICCCCMRKKKCTKCGFTVG